MIASGMNGALAKMLEVCAELEKFAAWRRREFLRTSGCGFESRRQRKQP